MEKFDDAQKCSISSPQNLERGRGPVVPEPMPSEAEYIRR